METAPEKIDHHRRHLLKAAAATIAVTQLSLTADAHPRTAENAVQRAAETHDAADSGVSVVLVHGAWADGSGWDRVIAPLQSKGIKAMAAPIPLTSLSDDIAALEWSLERAGAQVHSCCACLLRRRRRRVPQRKSSSTDLYHVAYA